MYQFAATSPHYSDGWFHMLMICLGVTGMAKFPSWTCIKNLSPSCYEQLMTAPSKYDIIKDAVTGTLRDL